MILLFIILSSWHMHGTQQQPMPSYMYHLLLTSSTRVLAPIFSLSLLYFRSVWLHTELYLKCFLNHNIIYIFELSILFESGFVSYVLSIRGLKVCKFYLISIFLTKYHHKHQVYMCLLNYVWAKVHAFSSSSFTYKFLNVVSHWRHLF